MAILCIIALVVFSVMGIFSAKYRQYAKDSFKCVYNMALLRPCELDMERRIKHKFIITLSNLHAPSARFANQNFKAISVVFVLLLLVSSVYSAYTIYNLITLGTCEPHSTSCIFNPQSNLSCGSKFCADNGCECDNPAIGCDSPDFAACEGNCSCKKTVCG
jgi:hypothetical protein